MKYEYIKIENSQTSFAMHKLEVKKFKTKPQTGRKYLQHL